MFKREISKRLGLLPSEKSGTEIQSIAGEENGDEEARAAKEGKRLQGSGFNVCARG
jgi:hypothetical protein